MTRRAAKLLMLALALWGALAPCALAKPVILHPPLPGNELAENSLRPNGVFGPIPQEAINAGFLPNDLSTSVRTDVVPTTRAAVVEIAGGTYTEPYVASTANRTIRLMGNVTYDGAGVSINATNITVDLNGYSLTYNNVDVEGLETGTVSSSTAGDGSSTYPTLTPSGLTLTANSHQYWVLEFTSGAENGNFYEVVSNTTTVLTLENHNQVSDENADLRNWQNGGPSASDTFRIYDPRKTFGVGVPVFVYPGTGTIEIVNGTIVQGAGFGRGVNRAYCAGMSPVFYYDGGRQFLVGGVSATWDAENSCGIDIRGSNSAVVQFCEVTDNGTLVTNRQRSQATIQTKQNSTVQNNLIRNHRQGGVGVDSGSTVEYNEIYGDSRATNSTGAGSFSTDNITIRYNNFYKVGQHPVCIGIAEETDGMDIYGNWCEAQSTRESPEYGYNFACAFSNRWGTRTGANHVHENAFITHASDSVYKSRSVLTGGYDVLVEELFEDNFVGAYSDDNTECHAVACGFDGWVARNNTLVSTHNIYWLADHYDGPENYPRWIDNTSIRSGSDPAFATFFVDDFWDQEVDFISGTYGSGTAADDISGTGDAQTVLRFGYNLTVTVTDGGSPVEGAIVTVKDKDSNILRDDYVTDASGVVVVDVPTYRCVGPSMTPATLAPLTVEAELGAATGSNTISPTSDDAISVGIAE